MEYWNNPKMGLKEHDQLENLYITSFPILIQPLVKKVMKRAMLVEMRNSLLTLVKRIALPSLIGIAGGLILVTFLKVVLRI